MTSDGAETAAGPPPCPAFWARSGSECNMRRVRAAARQPVVQRFVRHAYFAGEDDPYDRLRKALRADIDAAAWDSLHSTTSRPFPRPSTGRIAVKVINHYSDEVLKTCDT